MADTINIGNYEVSCFKVGSSDCKIYLGDTLLYPHSTPTVKDYLRFIAKGDGYFTFFSTGSASGNSLSYSLDSGTTWNTLVNSGTTPYLDAGDVIMWKGSNLTIRSGGGIGTFSGTSYFDVEGNIMSLHYGDNFEDKTTLSGVDYAFMNLFSGCTFVQNADKLELPATTLSKQCYCNMFIRASELVTLPSLSAATTLAEGCCQNMFYASPQTSALTLTESYFLPAQTLVKDCYRQMFYGRATFDKITCLATSGINTDNSTNNWLTNTSNTGTFTRAHNVTWPSGNSGRKAWTLVNYN